MIRVFVHAAYGAHAGAIRATLACLLEIAGWRADAVERADVADIVYGPGDAEQPMAAGREFRPPAVSPDAWQLLSGSKPTRSGDHVVPDAAIVRAGSTTETDWVAVAAFFLCGMHEVDRTIMESSDVWATPGPRIAEWGLTAEPIVHVAVRAIADRIEAGRPFAGAASRWPAGKRYAVAITHDLDRYRKYRAGEFLSFAARSAGRGKPVTSAIAIAKAVASSAASVVASDPHVRSLNDWAEFERDNEIRSAIYVSVVGRGDPSGAENDVSYSLNDPGLVETLRRLDGDGWEIGLHSSIRAWDRENGFAVERERLHSVASIRAVGVRGHYWALDPADGIESLKRIARAGFEYDSSLGMNLVDGYRRGSNYPYRPFDSRDGSPAGVWEVGPVAMDQSVLLAGDTQDARAAAVRHRADEVRRNGGLLVLDWHTDSLAAGYMDGCVTAVLDLLRTVAADSECWVATPREIVRWCTTDRWLA